MCSSAEKGKMIEILKRAAEEKESEDEEREREREREDGCSSLEERLAGVDLGKQCIATLVQYVCDPHCFLNCV